MDKVINKKVVLNTLDLFQNQFGWTTDEEQKSIFLDEFLFLKDFEDNEFVVRAEIKDELWKKGGRIRYSTIITSAHDDYINYDINTEVDYFVFFNKKCDQVFICKREDLVQKDNLIFRNQEIEGKTYYNKPCYEIHISMCELYEKREDGWYEKINVMAAVNPLGYGVAGLNILKELDKVADISLFPIGQPQPSTQVDAQFVQHVINKQSDFDPSAPCLKIWHEHSLAERIGKGKYYGFPIFELNKFDQRRLKNLDCCDEIITCSNWARDIVLEQTERPENEVHTVPLGVDRTVFNEAKSKVSGTQFVIFNCGKWEVRKGHDVLFRAFKMAFPDEVRDVKLFMMCENPFPQAKQQSEQFQNMYASDIRVKLIPRVNTAEEVAQIMGQVDCGVFPARGEGWNLELLEMMSMGKPVIATNYSGHTQFCNAMNCSLVDIEKTEPAFDGVWFDGKVGEWASLGQNQVKQLADHMRRAYDLWKKEPITNPAGIETAKEFTWENTAKKLLGVL